MNPYFPKVSIITICFNSEQTIEDTLKSIQQQTYPNLEYIVIDGGSSDNTISVIDTYGIATKVVSEADRGISDAFNKGLALADGEYIQLINSDDWLGDCQITNSVDLLENNPQAGYCYGDLAFHDDRGDFLYTKKGESHYAEIINYRMPFLNHPTVMVRKTVYDDFGGFGLEYKYAMDYEWFLRCHKGGVKGVYSPIIKAHMRDGGVSRKFFYGTIREVYEISTSYGLNRFVAKQLYVKKVVKRFMSDLLSHFLDKEQINKLRSFLNRKIKV